MLLAILPALISALVPVLISAFQSTNPTASNSQAHTWVQGMFQDIATALAKDIPSWLNPEMPALLTLVTTLVETELNKILPA